MSEGGVELRCEHKILFGVLYSEQGVVEFKCRSARCGARPGAVVIHRFDVHTGVLLKTYKFKDPGKREEVQEHG